MSLTREQVIKWLNGITIKGGAVADIGCGSKPAAKWANIKADEYVRMDFDPNCMPDQIIDLNIPSIDNEAVDKYQNHFNHIFCIETLEHIIRPYEAFQTFYDLLKPGGKLYLSVVFIYAHHGDNDCLRFTDHGLRQLAKSAGFRNIKIIPRIATAGKDFLLDFYDVEGMHSGELRDITYRQNVPIGYCLEATK